jgi:hypothetical protein
MPRVEITPSPCMQTFFGRPDRVTDPLYVICPIYNPIRFRNRWKLYQDFKKRVHEAGAILITVELAFGNREFSVTEADDPFDLQLRTSHELWHKERLVNLAVERLPSDWRYVSWIDSDFRFARDDWANATVHALQHYHVVQMYSQLQDLTDDQQACGPVHRSFMDVYVNGADPTSGEAYDSYGSGRPGTPGGAHACTRWAWDALGGLIDIGILGSGDWYMSLGLTGQIERALKPNFHPQYKHLLRIWQERAERHIQRNVGVVEGLALHYWHGPKAKRGYGTRNEILANHQFNPDVDLKRDWQGVYQLTERSIGLRDDIRSYFRARREDDPR